MTLRKRTHHFPRRADNRLMELVAQFQRNRRRLDALTVREDRCVDWEAYGPVIRAETTALVEECWRIRETVCKTAARTFEGLRAKAWLAAWEIDDPSEHPDVAVAWSLARDIGEGQL